MFYSAANKAFYDREIHGYNIPSDAIEITREQHAALMAGQSGGQVIGSDAQGLPVLMDRPDPEPASPAAQIDALERQYMLPRPVRDVLLPLMEAKAAELGYTPAQLRIANPGYRRVKELDEQIAALRAML